MSTMQKILEIKLVVFLVKEQHCYKVLFIAEFVVIKWLYNIKVETVIYVITLGVLPLPSYAFSHTVNSPNFLAIKTS